MNLAKQHQTHNIPTIDVANINSANKVRDLQLANELQIVHLGKERMPQMIQRHGRVTLHSSTHPKWEQDSTEKI